LRKSKAQVWEENCLKREHKIGGTKRGTYPSTSAARGVQRQMKKGKFKRIPAAGKIHKKQVETGRKKRPGGGQEV